MKKRELGVAIVTLPLSEAGVIPLSHLVEIVRQLTNDLYLLTGDAAYDFFRNDERVRLYEIRHSRRPSIFTRLVRYVPLQVQIAAKATKAAANVDTFIFFIAAEGLVIPMLTLKLLRKKVVIASAGSVLKVAQVKRDPLAGLVVPLQSIAYRLADRIILYSENLIRERGLERYKHKISIAHRHFLNFDKFKIQQPLAKRDNLVGHIGRLSEEKGTLNFLEAIPRVVEMRDNVAFVIGGDGQLRPRVEEYANKSNSKVKYAGWISHDELPEYLNEFKLLVLPSYTEGLPNIMVEAMACGTPVLAAPVGAIPDIIKDGENGFIMESNSPDCVATSIVRALNHPDLEQIARNARALVEKEFTFDKAVERYRAILDSA